MESITEKKCTECLEVKNISDFYKARSTKDRFTNLCKICYKEKVLARYWKNPEPKREYSRNKYRENPPKEYIKQWRRNNPEKLRTYERNRKSLKKHNGGKVTEKQWRSVLEKYGNKCLYPNCENTDITQDHVIPLSRGGMHSVDNLQPLCKKHNFEKHTNTVDYRK